MPKTEKIDRQKIRKHPAQKIQHHREKQRQKLHSIRKHTNAKKRHALKFASPKKYPTQKMTREIRKPSAQVISAVLTP
jgi:hypothetical protein